MSLNKLLSVGRSFVGIRDRKTPFEMRKECLLPIFEPAPRFVQRSETPSDAPEGPVQTDWLEAEPVPLAQSPAAAVPEVVAPKLEAKAPAPQPKPEKRSLWSRLTFGLFDRKRPVPSLGAALVQSELSLDRVRPIRNDLQDSDLELVLKKRPQARKASVAASFAPETGEETKPRRRPRRLFEPNIANKV